MKRIIAFDVSFTTIGICVLSYDNDVVILDYINHYKPPNNGNLFQRLATIRSFIQNLLTEFQPVDVIIEDIVLFMPDKSSANTIVTLAILNRLIGLIVFDILNKPPYFYNVMRIRHVIKKDKLPAKEDIPELVAEILNIKFPYLKNKKGEFLKENNDMADAAACGICHIYMDRALKADKLQIKKKRKRRKRKGGNGNLNESK